MAEVIAVSVETLDEARKTLLDVQLDNAHDAQQAALMRLQLWLTGETHRILADFAKRARDQLLSRAGSDGLLDGAGAFQAQQAILNDWQSVFMDEWLPLFQIARREAGSIPFGVLALYHEKLVRPAVEQIQEQAEGSTVFEPQLQALMDAANQRVYGDGLQLSSRIWNLDRDSRDGINQAIMRAISEQRSAWETARDLEAFLGAGQDCPRWTSTRLYRLTKKDIASGDRRGLLSGDECSAKGVAYKALRLARNEIQAIHHIASDRIMEAQPWIEAEKINLSPAHPPIGCKCEEIVVGGENSDGVYPVGTIRLPIHVHCLCYKTTVMQSDDEFISGLRSWLNDESGAAASEPLDQYADFLGVRKQEIGRSFLEDTIAAALVAWLWGQAREILGRVAA